MYSINKTIITIMEKTATKTENKKKITMILAPFILGVCVGYAVGKPEKTKKFLGNVWGRITSLTNKINK